MGLGWKSPGGVLRRSAAVLVARLGVWADAALTLSTEPRLLRALDRLGIGRPVCLVLAPVIAALGRPIVAWRLVDARRDGPGDPAARRAEARIFLAAGDLVAAASLAGVEGRRSTGAVVRLLRAARRPPSPPAPEGLLPWRDLAPGAVGENRRRPAPGRLIAALGRRRRHRSILWWSRRGRTRDSWREAEALLALDRFDDAIAMVNGPDACPALRLRVLSEVHLRRGDLAAFEQLIAAALRERHRRVVGRSPLRWLVAHLFEQPNPTLVLDRDLAERVVAVAGRHDLPSVERELAEVLDCAFVRRLRDLQSSSRLPAPPLAPAAETAVIRAWTRSVDEAAVSVITARGAAAFRAGDLPDDWPTVAAVIDAHLAAADLPTAEAIAVAHARRRARGARAVSLAEVEGLAGRFPTSPALIDLLIELADRDQRAAVAASVRDWRRRVVADDPRRLIGVGRGRTCWVVGNGPSLAVLPLARLAGDDVICVNRGHAAMALGLPQPRFLVVSDAHVYGDHKREIDAAPVERLFLHGLAVLRRPSGLPERVEAFGASGLRLAHRPLESAPWVVHRGGSVVVIAAQIAALLGYEDIRLIGVDLDYSQPATHFYGGSARDRERLAAFRAGGGGAAIVDAAFANLAVVLARRGCRIVNAGHGGNLHSLPREPLVAAR